MKKILKLYCSFLELVFCLGNTFPPCWVLFFGT